MNAALIEGLSMGVLLSALIGPVFFTLLQSSLERGFRYAAILALGIIASDTIYVVLTFYGVRFLSDAGSFEVVLGYLGGAILIGFGLSSLLKEQAKITVGTQRYKPKARKRNAFLKGFSINGVNPFVLIFWISIASLVHVRQTFTSWDIWMYYTGILGTVFTVDLTKAFIAKRVSKFVTPKVMFWLNKAVGAAMIGFGLRMLWVTIF